MGACGFDMIPRNVRMAPVTAKKSPEGSLRSSMVGLLQEDQIQKTESREHDKRQRARAEVPGSTFFGVMLREAVDQADQLRIRFRRGSEADRDGDQEAS